MDSAAADRARLGDIDIEISYPVLTLPTDITSEIFTHFLPSTLPICRQWRQIAVATPGLWRAISFNENYYSIPFAQQLHLGQLWLARSRSYPLSVQFGDLHAPDTAQIFKAITPHRTRCEYLDLILSPSEICAFQGPMPILRHLTLMMHYDLHDVVTFSPAPLLRSATLRIPSPLDLTLPWGQLTSLTLNSAYRFEYVAILRQTCTLVHCELESLLGLKPIDHLSAFISKSGCKLQKVHLTNRGLVSKASYREAFPSNRFSFDDDSDAASISTHS
ncbi:hypothetical protein K438DRAFT_1865723 [Mycena galopus ATCC 62051]|nr:hypothetical protein K438DRAFT_1865723 [Mycena galopus ATCC 62051]